ncbi:MAG: HvfC/BufC N-terminal domain-containing protein [Paracoccaceae bacterium]
MSVGQTVFTAALLDPEHAIPEGLSDPQGRPAGRRFSVYRNNVAVSLTDALQAAFPVIHKLVGTEFFNAMSGVYLRKFPPTSPLMMFYGAEMPAFLAGFEPVSHLGYLPDIARLELAMRQSYHAADSDAIAPDDLQAMSMERLMSARLILAPAVRLIGSEWPIFSIWQANMRDGAPAPQMQAETVLITRPDLDPTPVALGMGGGLFVESIGKGNSFGTAVEAAGDGFDLTEMLDALLAGAAIIQISEKE